MCSASDQIVGETEFAYLNIRSAMVTLTGLSTPMAPLAVHRPRRVLKVLLLDPSTQAACKPLRNSANNTDTADFFGLKQRQVDCPVVPGWVAEQKEEEATIITVIC